MFQFSIRRNMPSLVQIQAPTNLISVLFPVFWHKKDLKLTQF